MAGKKPRATAEYLYSRAAGSITPGTTIPFVPFSPPPLMPTSFPPPQNQTPPATPYLAELRRIANALEAIVERFC